MSSINTHARLVGADTNSTKEDSKILQSQFQSSIEPNRAEHSPSRKSFESEDSIALQKARASSTLPKDRSTIMSVVDKARRKLSPSSSKDEAIPSSEAEFESIKEKEEEKERRKAEYEKLKLGDKTKFGMGGMQMGN